MISGVPILKHFRVVTVRVFLRACTKKYILFVESVIFYLFIHLFIYLFTSRFAGRV